MGHLLATGPRVWAAALLLVTSGGLAANLIPNGDLEAAPPGAKIATGYSGLDAGLSLEAGHNGRHSQRYDAGKEGDWCEGLDTPTFPVTGGRTYVARLWTRARDMRVFHIKWRFYDAAGQHLVFSTKGQATTNYYQFISPVGQLQQPQAWDWEAGLNASPASERNGSWDWEQWAYVGQAPASAGSARLEFWCRTQGGSFWVDDLSVEDANQALQVKRPAPVAWQPKPSRPAVRVLADRVAVSLANGLKLDMKLAGGEILGLGRVRLGVLPLRGDQAGRLFVHTAEGGHFVRCRLLRARLAGDSAVVEGQLSSAQGPSAKLTWTFSPAHASLGGAAYDGLRITTRYDAAGTPAPPATWADQMLEQFTWELGGAGPGLRISRQTHGAWPASFAVKPLTATGYTWMDSRYGARQCFDYQEGPEGSLIILYDPPGAINSSLYTANPDGLLYYRDHSYGPLAPTMQVSKVILAGKPHGPDAWAAAFDYAGNLARRHYGLREEQALPTVNYSTLCYMALAGAFAKVAEKLPRFAELGFKRVYIGPVEENDGNMATGSACAPWRVEIAAKLGGETELKRLCDAAHELGLQIIAWHATSHLSDKSPLLREHPDWAMRDADGKPIKCGYGDITGVSLLSPYGAYAVDQWRGIRQRTGLDGLWLDSYPNFGYGAVDYSRPDHLPQADRLCRLQAELQKLGLVLLIEGLGPFGLTSNGLDPETYANGLESYAYKTSYYSDVNSKFWPQLDYFRFLASGSCPFAPYDFLDQDPALAARVKRANLDYVAALPWMKQRHVLADGRGIEWRGERGLERVIFAFQSFRLPGGSGTAEAGKVYRIKQAREHED